MIEKLSQDINHLKGIMKEKKTVYVYVIPNEEETYKNASNKINKKVSLKVNIFSVSDKEKYDPENKSKKAKPGKPAIYLE